MASNDRIILEEVLKQRQDEFGPSTSASWFFELFTCEQILKDLDLSYDEIESGLVGDGGDGGIDGFYLFVNGELVQEDPDYARLKKNINIDLIIIQSKTEKGFKESPIERFITASDDILDLSKSVESLKPVYNSSIIAGIEKFRMVQKQLASKFPNLRINFYYACKGDTPEKNTERKVEKLEKIVKGHFQNCEFSFDFLGASELLALARRAPQSTYTLTLAENPISAEGQVGFVCLIQLRDFIGFLSDDKGHLRRQIFEANVRDYQGRTEVNDAIQESLREKIQNREDFWWLNNGVTVLASKASLSGKALTIEDPQIVNGLQTSTEVFNYWSKYKTDDDNRRILVRVIVPSADESRDRIIKATNSQTAIQLASLRATDKIHRDIEEFLRPRGFFYDRRKNHYKNEGKPREKIIGIPYLAQAIISVLLQRPDTARARPSTLLKKDETYKKVFNEDIPVELYFVCAEGIKRVESRLKESSNNLSVIDRNNLRFYVLLHSMVQATGTTNPTMKDYANLDIKKLSVPLIDHSIKCVKEIYTDLGGTDQVAKGSDFVSKVKESFMNN